jgi:hypothetical protein
MQMLTPRRSAQLGLGAACLIMVSSVAVLVAGAADSTKVTTVQPDTSKTIQTPASTNHVQNLPVGMTQSFAIVDKH